MDPAPTVYLFYGNDRLAIHEAITSMREKLGEPATADMNLQRFLGPDVDLNTLIQSSTVAPFLSHRRLTVIDQAERLPDEAEWQTQFFDFLETLPASAALVLIEDTEFYREKKRPYEASSSLYQWAGENPDRTYIQAFNLPTGPAFVTWIRNRCKSMGGTIDPTAAHLLADWVGEDPHLAIEELGKLLDYVDLKRPIDRADVQQLTPYRGQEDIFAMVDAVGQRKGQQAQQSLHVLLADEDIRYVFAMIVRQFRLLILAREALNDNLPPKQALPQMTPDFVVKKISAQAKNFSLDKLESIYHELLEIDLAGKLGGFDLASSLDTFIVKHCAEVEESIYS